MEYGYNGGVWLGIDTASAATWWDATLISDTVMKEHIPNEVQAGDCLLLMYDGRCYVEDCTNVRQYNVLCKKPTGGDYQQIYT